MVFWFRLQPVVLSVFGSHGSNVRQTAGRAQSANSAADGIDDVLRQYGFLRIQDPVGKSQLDRLLGRQPGLGVHQPPELRPVRLAGGP